MVYDVAQVSSVASRPQLNVALVFVREGDTLIVMKLDRLARSMANLLAIQRERIAKAKGEGRYKGRKPTVCAKADESAL